MRLKLIPQEEIDRLIVNVSSNINNYLKKEVWLNDWLQESGSTLIDIDTIVKNIKLILPREKSNDTDFENSKILYEALKDIPIELATDNRFWCYLTHDVFWEYMTERWPIEGLEEKKIITRIKDRYLMRNSGDKSLLRNQISRLWWMVHSTYDNTIDNPYEYTEFLLSNSDFQVGLMERTFSRNSSFTKNVIKAIKSYSEEYEYPNKDMIRIFLKELNALGGVKVLDLIEYNYLYDFTKNIFNSIKR